MSQPNNSTTKTSPPKRVYVTLRKIVINSSGYEQNTGIYYGNQRGSWCYRATWIPDPEIVDNEQTIEFRATSRWAAKEKIGIEFQSRYFGAIVPRYHN